ncbi:hypothetical protein [Streptomyces sp. NPDC006193]|uniref:hypothetical protein n=1 Tax=Streptomyces sp. NPDC006193 TaxID=3155717 RepID=UPI0033A9093E
MPEPSGEGGRAIPAGPPDAGRLVPVGALPAGASRRARAASFDRAPVCLAGLQRATLCLLTDDETAAHDGEAHIAGTVAARAHEYGDVLPAAPPGDGARACRVPLPDGTERIGPPRVGTARDDARARADAEALAALVPLIAVGARRGARSGG